MEEIRIRGMGILRTILAFCALLVFLSSTISQRAHAVRLGESPASYGELSMLVHLFSIDARTKQAEVQIFVEIRNFPYNASELHIWVVGGSGGYFRETELLCRKYSDGYWGKSNVTQWYLIGSGSSFPFDSYRMEFVVGSTFSYCEGNTTHRISRGFEPDIIFTLSSATGLVAGDKSETIMIEWVTSPVYLPISYLIEGFEINIVRKVLIPFLVFVVPIVACYFLLGASVFIKRSKLGERIRLYLTLFVFSSTFFFAIQSFLPLRDFLSIPEFLLTNLTTSSAVFAIFSMVPPTERENAKRAFLLDCTATVLGASIFTGSLSAMPHYFADFPTIFYVVLISAYFLPLLGQSRMFILDSVRAKHDGISTA